MSRRIWRVFLILCVVPALAHARTSSALGSGREFKNPIAFVGADGVFITDAQGSSPTPLVLGDTSGELPIYSRPRWSPTGSELLLSETTVQKGLPRLRVLRVQTGAKPEALQWSSNSGWPSILPMDWLPNSAQVVFIDGRGVYLLPLDGPQPKLLFKCEYGPSLGEPGDGLDPSQRLLARELEREIYRTTYHVIATAEGLLLSDGCLTGETWSMVTLQGKVLWTAQLRTQPLVSPDGHRGVARYAGNLEGSTASPNAVVNRVVLIDLKTGKVTEVPFNPGAVPLGWSADGKSIYLGLGEKPTAVAGSAESEVGPAMFGVEWPFTAVEYTLTLWRLPLEGPARSNGIKLSEARGYNFGVMTVSGAVGGEKLPLLVSVVSSSVPLIQAINAGAKREDAATLMPTVRLYAIDPESGELLWTQRGGRPAYGKDRFMVVVSP